MHCKKGFDRFTPEKKSAFRRDVRKKGAQSFAELQNPFGARFWQRKHPFVSLTVAKELVVEATVYYQPWITQLVTAKGPMAPLEAKTPQSSVSAANAGDSPALTEQAFKS